MKTIERIARKHGEYLNDLFHDELMEARGVNYWFGAGPLSSHIAAAIHEAAAPQVDRETARRIFDAGFIACGQYGDNKMHYRGEQADRVFMAHMDKLGITFPAPPKPQLSDHYQQLAMEAVREWDGVSNHDMLQLIADKFGMSVAELIGYKAKKVSPAPPEEA